MYDQLGMRLFLFCFLDDVSLLPRCFILLRFWNLGSSRSIRAGACILMQGNSGDGAGKVSLTSVITGARDRANVQRFAMMLVMMVMMIAFVTAGPRERGNV